jgi:streptogramin lyase
MTRTRQDRKRETWGRVVAVVVLGLCAACGGRGDDTGLDGGHDGDAGDVGDGDGAVGCIDADGDGYGRNCAPGPDCDDADPAHHDDCPDCGVTHAPGCPCLPGDSFACYDGPAGTEDVGVCRGGTRLCVGRVVPYDCIGQVLPMDGVDTLCNGMDDDCDGVGDDELYGACGDCDLSCYTEGRTVPNPEDPGSEGLMPNPDGPGVVLGSDLIRAGFLYAANDPEGTVSKLDLATGAEVGRYHVGLWGTGCDSPSRTAVDGRGNAYVASRAHMGCPGANQGSVTKLAGDTSRYCIDRNASGAIDTSTGSTPMPLNTDECWLWTVPVGGPGATPRGLALDMGDELHPEGYPWVGAWSEMKAYKLNPDTGEVIATVDLTVNPYGLAADAAGWIWVSGRSPDNGYIQRFYGVTGEVQERIPYGGASGCNGQPYGITVDRSGRVWAASWYADGDAGCAARYDPATGTWMAVHTGRDGWGGRGIAAGADGTVWMSIHYNWGGGAMASWNGEDGSGVVVRDVAGVIPVGIALDELGQVWTVNQSSSNVTRFIPATGALQEFPVGPNPYTYSDFTGYQRRLVNPRGTWIRDYERCARGEGDRWGDLIWDVGVPPGRITIAGQSSDDAEALGSAPVVVLAIVGTDVPPVDLEAAFAAASVPLGRYLRITVTIEGDPSDPRSPVFRSLEVRWRCSAIG